MAGLVANPAGGGGFSYWTPGPAGTAPLRPLSSASQLWLRCPIHLRINSQIMRQLV